MPANQRRYAQAIPAVYIFIGIAVLFCLGTLGIKTLMLKQQIKQDGERLGLLRKELREFTTSNESLRTEKNKLTSIPALKEAIRKGVIKLKPIESRFVLNVPADRRSVAAHAARTGSEGGR